jgi:hypothetical protein
VARRRGASRGAGEPPADAGPGPRGVAVGLLAMAPLFAAYELGLAEAGDGGPRNVAELALGRAFAFLPAGETALRIACLAGALVVAFVQVRVAGLPLLRALVRTVLEGVGFALALGPLLLLALAALGVGAEELGLAPRAAGAPVDAARAARAFGAGAWEELLFRVGGYSALFVMARGVFGFFGAGEGAGRWLAETCALLGSSVLFAAGHLDAATRFVGIEGESFDGGVFLWRTVAGIFLAGLFRWRGPGVAAWSHGLFNLALILGSGPGVLS